MPGQFHLPLPHGGWKDDITSRVAAHFNRWHGVFGQTYQVPVALDIAVRSDSPVDKDLDNLARPILAAFAARYCDNNLGTVSSYRVYLAPGASGVRVKVMHDATLEAIERAMEDAQRWVVAHPRIGRST